ncbi:hypothetical protein ACFWOG_12465 [Kitasatospora sp. NPDC058406]|uniref:hypothetical protein n=1 Tax=Kitasatospora sp. NPDC058406 TaxID=3346483 RepID=UPI003669885B
MNTDDTSQPPTVAPAPVATPSVLRIPQDSGVRPAAPAPTRERVLDLVALVLLIGLAAAVFILAGPGAVTAVTSVGMGLFATWRSRR